MADWVAPDTPAAPAVRPAPGAAAPAPPAPGRRDDGTRSPAVPVPVPLRPLTIPDVLDGGLRAWKLAPATMAGLAAAFVVPTQIVLGVATRDRADDIEIGQTFADAFTATGPGDLETGFGGAFYASVAIQGLALAFVTAAVARLVSGWYVGRRPGFGEVAVGALRRTWPLAAGWFLVHVIEVLFAILLLVPAIVPMTWYAVVSAVVGCEPVGPWRALRRSAALCRRRFGAVLGTSILVAVTDAVLSSALTSLGALYLETDLPAGWIVSTVVTAASLLVTVPFVAAVVTLLYLDLRVRTEGMDIELAVAERW